MKAFYVTVYYFIQIRQWLEGNLNPEMFIFYVYNFLKKYKYDLALPLKHHERRTN